MDDRCAGDGQALQRRCMVLRLAGTFSADAFFPAPSPHIRTNPLRIGAVIPTADDESSRSFFSGADQRPVRVVPIDICLSEPAAVFSVLSALRGFMAKGPAADSGHGSPVRFEPH